MRQYQVGDQARPLRELQALRANIDRGRKGARRAALSEACTPDTSFLRGS